MHLILPLAASHHWPDTLPDARALPQLDRLLSGMRLAHTLADASIHTAERPHPLLPHERVLARELGWPDEGPWPQAALDSAQAGAQAWLTPCHWQVGMDRVVMLAPEVLQLDDEESRQLLQAMQPWLAEDGLQVQWQGALRWHARGELLSGVRTASLGRVSGADIRPWITDGSLPPALRRLQSEMQMLLYNHPVNDARMARGQFTVNSFWLHGAGNPAVHQGETPVQTRTDLQQAAAQGSGAWLKAWQRLDAEVLAPLTPVAPGGEPLQLTLCSETRAHTWVGAPKAGWPQRLARFTRLLRPVHPDAALRALLPPDERT
jgi:hypothetical protein